MWPFVIGIPFMFAASRYSYLLFHMAVEMFCVIVAASVFLFAWNSRRIIKNDFFFFLGTTYLFVGVIDFLHALTYKGMQILPTTDANMPTQLWVAGRYLLGISLLIAPLFITRKLNKSLLLIAYTVITIGLLMSIFVWPVFPASYIEGIGLTPFKINSEYIICGMILLAAILFWRYKNSFDPRVSRYLLLAFGFSIASELLFTEYVGVFDLANEIGHFFKLLSYYLVYKAIIEIGLSQPYELLFLEQRRLQQQKNEFLRIASHELKNPLTTIEAYAELLMTRLGGRHKTEEANFVVKIQNQARRINHLIDELLDVSKIESGRSTLTFSRFEVDELVGHVVQDFQEMIDDHTILLKGKARVKILGDRDHLSQVVINLLTNAIKYSPKNSTITVRVMADTSTVTITVEDQGIGIPGNKLKTVFKKYYRTRDAEQTNQGLGLGLFICKDIVSKHHGKIWVTSRPGKGSTFFVSLPLRP